MWFVCERERLTRFVLSFQPGDNHGIECGARHSVFATAVATLNQGAPSWHNLENTIGPTLYGGACSFDQALASVGDDEFSRLSWKSGFGDLYAVQSDADVDEAGDDEREWFKVTAIIAATFLPPHAKWDPRLAIFEQLCTGEDFDGGAEWHAIYIRYAQVRYVHTF